MLIYTFTVILEINTLDGIDRNTKKSDIIAVIFASDSGAM